MIVHIRIRSIQYYTSIRILCIRTRTNENNYLILISFYFCDPLLSYPSQRTMVVDSRCPTRATATEVYVGNYAAGKKPAVPSGPQQGQDGERWVDGALPAPSQVPRRDDAAHASPEEHLEVHYHCGAHGEQVYDKKKREYVSGPGIVVTYFNGDMYQGSMKDGLRDGPGSMRYRNGNMYVGDWVDNLKVDVDGTMYYWNEERYVHFFF